MAAEAITNNAQSTLNGNINASVTSISVASDTPFPQAGQYRIIVDSEIMLVTGGQGTVNWTVTRGAETTVAASHNSGAVVTHILTAGAISNLAGSTYWSNFAPAGLTGATTATRYVGGTSSGPPTSGTFVAGDYVIDPGLRTRWICATGGSPGTWIAPPLGRLGETILTSSATTWTTTTTDIAGLAVTVTVQANRKIEVGFKGSLTSTTDTQTMEVLLKEGATVLRQSSVVTNSNSQGAGNDFSITLVTPSAGSHTYKVSARRDAGGSGTGQMLASATQPIEIYVNDLGSSV